MKKIKYIVIAGSSGGHILPALAYINNLSLVKDPKSILFCSKIGLNYVSCSPYRVPIARLAAAQAELKKRYLKIIK